MEVKLEPTDYYQGNLTIKQEPIFITSDWIKEVKEEDEINEVKASDFFVSESDFISIKQEIDLSNSGNSFKQSCNTHSRNQSIHSKLKVLEKERPVKRKRFPCPVCQKNVLLPQNHLSKHFGKTCIICKYCGKFFIEKYQYLRHYNHYVKRTKKMFPCNICLERFVSNKQLVEHCNMHLPLYECDICLRKFKKKRYLASHSRYHERGRMFQCEICSKTFMKNANLQAHIKTHTGERPYKCHICSKGYIKNSTLLRHIKTHTGERNFRCEICNKKFYEKQDVVAHMITHAEGTIKCDMCPKTFNHNVYLNNHIKNIHTERQFKCDFCKKSYAKSHDLKRHKLSHTGEESFKCESCPKAFITAYKLKHHMRCHSDEKAFECEICNKKFKRKNNLNQHLKTHNKEKIVEGEEMSIEELKLHYAKNVKQEDISDEPIYQNIWTSSR